MITRIRHIRIRHVGISILLLISLAGVATGQDEGEVSAYLDAIREGDITAMSRFYRKHDTVNVSTPDIYGPRPRTAFVAVESGRANVVRWLIDRGMEVDLYNRPDGYTIGYTPISRAVVAEQTEIIRLLLEADASLERGEPLAMAAQRGNLEVAQMLIDAGAEPDSERALRVAAANNHAQLLELLLGAGADPNNGAPLTTAVFWDSEDAAAVLRAAGADPTQSGPIGGQLVRTWMHATGIHPTYGRIPDVRANVAQVHWLKTYRVWGDRVPMPFAASASSALPDYPPYFYDASQAFDGDSRTAWNEADEGSGVGEWLEIELDETGFSDGLAWISAIEVEGGFFDERWFRQNNRLKRARVVLNPGTEDIAIDLQLPDAMEPARVEFGPYWVHSLRIEVLETYPGTDWNDLPISEVRLYAPVAGVNGASDFDVLIPLEGYPRPEPLGWTIDG